MNVVFISPGFPVEMPQFVHGLAAIGARVIGVGESPAGALAPEVRRRLAHYVQVESLWDEDRAVIDVCAALRGTCVDRVECLWEPGVILAAKIRRVLDVPGLTVEQAHTFRDKELMKRVLDDAGIRTPRHERADDEAGWRAAAERIGYPLILKPLAGAGSADTHRVDSAADLERILPRLRHRREMSIEEFIDGEEFTFDTICADGRIEYHNVSWYRPRPLIARTVETLSPQTLALRQPSAPALRDGVRMGHAVLAALGFRTGFTHMEWFRTATGEAVFGEIAARPPGAISVDIMNHASDLDTFVGWAEAVCLGRFSQTVERRYNAAVIFKRARGAGTIERIEGLERLVARYRPSVVDIDLLPPGAPRRNWKQTLLSDGWIIVRHPDLHATMEIADRFGTELTLYAA
jgi:hypothetical protein